TEADIRLQLRKEELQDAASGTTPVHGTSATAFLTAGLQLEDAQRRLKADTVGVVLTADGDSKVHEHRLSFLSKLRKFRDLQRVYTPGAIRVLAVEEAARDEDAVPPKAEYVKLYLPSTLPAAERLNGCQRGLPEMEACLREAQCSDSLVKLRSLLYSKGHLITFRNENVTGQIDSTRSQTLIGRVGGRVTRYQQKYVQARESLLILKGNDYAPHLKPLLAEHLTLDGEERESDSAARRKLARLGGGKHGRDPRNAPSKDKVLSWIWSARGALDEQEKDLHESLRVEWSRAKARKTRWEEEVSLLREEMRRVLRYLDWQAAFWQKLADVPIDRDDVSAPTQSGKAAYAAKQA
ncbi:hypothetical protein C8R47DRAFT_933397, partial [Mycena vitilis]